MECVAIAIPDGATSGDGRRRGDVDWRNDWENDFFLQVRVVQGARGSTGDPDREPSGAARHLALSARIRAIVIAMSGRVGISVMFYDSV